MTKSPKSLKEEGVKNKSFGSRFKKLNLPLHGLRLPDFKISDEHLREYNLERGVSNLDFLKTVCRKRAQELGLHKLPNKDEYKARIEKEFKLLEELSFIEYMLLVWKVVKNARDSGMAVGMGRGSAAGSLVLYLLHVTSIDPIKYELYFERFVSPARCKKKVVNGITYLDGDLMCDVDIDVCFYKRQQILDYITSEFVDRSCKIRTLNTLSSKLVIKECGKVVAGKSEQEVNAVSGHIPKVFGKVAELQDAYEEVDGFAKWCDENPKVFKIAKKLEELIKNKGVHPSAMLLSYNKIADEGACELDESKKPISSYEHNWAGKFWVKLDVLGLRTCSVIDDCCRFIRENRGIKIYPEDILDHLDDKDLYEKLNAGMALGLNQGIFQIEGDLATQACLDVKPQNFEQLSGVLALARPGAMDYIEDYAEWTNNGTYKAVHPFFDEVLQKTGGIVLYQEQMMKMAHMIGFTLDEAEVLRRIVGKKKVSEVKKWKKKIKDKVKENNLEKEIGDVLWKVLEDSANYSYNKSHSIAYAALSAATAYLKFNYPQEFFLALLVMTKHEPDPLELISKTNRELSEFDIKLLSPHLLKSENDFSLEGKNIRFGLTSIKGISEKSIEKLENFKTQYSSKFEVFQGAKDAKVGVGMLSALIQAGALEDDFGHSRSYIVAESQLWNLLTPREKALAFDLAKDKQGDLMEIVKYLNKELKDKNGKPVIKDSRIQTIRKNFAPYLEIYNKNKSNEDFANWYYENTLLGYTHGKMLREVSEEYSHLESIQDVLAKSEGQQVNFIATVVDTYSSKSKKGTPYLRISLKDETGELDTMIFTQKNRDNIEMCRRDNNGELPSKKGIVIVKGVKKDGNTVFANLVKIQDQQIYMKLSEIKAK